MLYGTDVNKGFPSGLYLTQQGSTTCTLCSAAMMLRVRAYQSGNANWKSTTESAIRSNAWINGAGLRWSFSYAGMTVSHEDYYGISLSSLKSLLSRNPAGIVLYCGNLPHAVYVMYCSGDTVYAADTISGYSGKKIPLASTYLGSRYGSQASILANVTDIWYVR